MRARSNQASLRRIRHLLHSTSWNCRTIAPAVAERDASAKPQPFGVINIPISGEVESGDSWQSMQLQNGLAVIVVDGRGHGPLAATASEEAVKVFNSRPFDTPTGCLEAAHAAMHGTRGAAAAVAKVDFTRHTLDYAGVGNISGSIVDRSGAKSRSLISFEGIVGSEDPQTAADGVSLDGWRFADYAFRWAD